MSGIDLAILVLIVLSIVISVLRGPARELISLAIWLFAILITLFFSSRFATLLPASIEVPSARLMISAAVLFFGSLGIGMLVRWLAGQLMVGYKPGIRSRIAGGIFGLLRGALIVAVLVLLANLTPAVKQENWWRESHLLPPFQDVARKIHATLPAELGQHFDFSPRDT